MSLREDIPFALGDLMALDDLASKPMVEELTQKLRRAGILTVIREARGRRGQILALGELVNLCEGRKVY